MTFLKKITVLLILSLSAMSAETTAPILKGLKNNYDVNENVSFTISANTEDYMSVDTNQRFKKLHVKIENSEGVTVFNQMHINLPHLGSYWKVPKNAKTGKYKITINARVADQRNFLQFFPRTGDDYEISDELFIYGAE